jgi:drug/metabolite transporter (DMT)-like permease
VYQELSMIPAAVGFLLLTLRRRGRAAVRAAIGAPAVAAGLFTFGAYILVLAALARAPAAPVAAVRETSIVIATALAVPFLHERVGPARIAGSVLVVLGVLLLAI